MGETSERILRAALETFGTHGYRQANMGLVAEAAGLSRQGVYQHFATKDDLFVALVDDVQARSLHAAARAARDAMSAGPAATVDALLWGRYGYFAAHLYARPHGADLVAESDRRCGERNAVATQRFRDLLRDQIEWEVADGRLVLDAAGLDTAVVADLLLRAVYGLKGREPDPLPLDILRERLRQMVYLLVASLIPQRSIS